MLPRVGISSFHVVQRNLKNFLILLRRLRENLIGKLQRLLNAHLHKVLHDHVQRKSFARERAADRRQPFHHHGRRGWKTGKRLVICHKLQLQLVDILAESICGHQQFSIRILRSAFLIQHGPADIAYVFLTDLLRQEAAHVDERIVFW